MINNLSLIVKSESVIDGTRWRRLTFLGPSHTPTPVSIITHFSQSQYWIIQNRI